MVRQVFDSHEGHDVLGIPADAARQFIGNVISLFQAISRMAGIIGQGYGVAAAIGDDSRFIIGQAADDLSG